MRVVCKSIATGDAAAKILQISCGYGNDAHVLAADRNGALLTAVTDGARKQAKGEHCL
jgi:hypothetical protein